MIVECLYNKIDQDLVSKFKISNPQKFEFNDLIVGKIYVVVSIYLCCKSDLQNGGYPFVYVSHDNNVYPLFLFKIIDDKPSRYWHIQYNTDEKALDMQPFSFYQKSYFSELADGVPEVVEDFNKISDLIEEEFRDTLLELKGIKAKAIPVEKPWLQCPECAEAFEAPTNRKFITCPKCQATMHNPYFEGYDCK
jgi:hypothetical protein